MMVDIDGESFSVLQREGEPGVYDFIWLSGPDPDYGFTIAASNGAPIPIKALEGAARLFLTGIDHETGDPIG